MQGKLFDYLFVTASIEEHIQERFIQKAHAIIKNAGHILIFLPKGESTVRWQWIRDLETHNYVASNTIDDVCDAYDVIVSKKMHGWGG